MDTCYAYGQNPSLLRERYYEAHDLVMRAWTEPDTFAFGGRFNRQRYVNIWPRPVQRPRQGGRLLAHALGDATDAVGAVVDGVHARHDRQQHLGRADVGGGLLPADVLLAGLERHPQGAVSVAVRGDVRVPDAGLDALKVRGAPANTAR